MERQGATPEEAERRGRKRLWFAILVGPLTWSADFALSYALTGHACTVQSASLLLVFSALAFGATLAGLLVAVRATHELPPSGSVDGTRGDPTRFMAVSGVAVSGGFLLAIVAAAIPRLVIDPCI